MKVLKVQIYENNRRIDKANYHGATVKECIEKMNREHKNRGVC